MKSLLLFAYLVFVGTSCGDDNLAAGQEDVDPDAEAQALMNDGDYEGAIAILEPLVEENPEEYSRFPLLASAYAGYAGVDLFSILSNQFSGAGGGDSIFDQIDAFLPSDYERDDVNTVYDAVALLDLIPESLLGSSGDPDYGESAEFQFSLYQALYSTMLLGLYVDTGADGLLDLDKLSEMTDEDAAAILAALEAAAANTDDENLQGSINDTLTAIDSSEGDSDRDKISNYVQSEQE